MDDWLPALVPNGLNDALLRAVSDSLQSVLIAYILVVTRLSGLFVIAPVFNNLSIPTQIRVFIVLAISLVLTPVVLGLETQKAWQQFDLDGDGQIAWEELPDPLRPQASRLWTLSERPLTEPIPLADVHAAPFQAATPADLAWQLAGEFGLGLSLGLGMLICLSTLQFVGHLIDQQTGVSLGDIFNPELDAQVSVTGELMHGMAMLLFLAAGGHLMMIAALLGTFESLPLGWGYVPLPMVELLSRLMSQSLVLTFQVAGPVIGSMALVGLAMGFMGHTIPQLNVLVIGFPIRLGTGLVLTMLSLPVMATAIERSFPAVVSQIRSLFTLP